MSPKKSTRKRKRARASDIAPRSSFSAGNFMILLAVLILLLAYRHMAGERTASFVDNLTGPSEALPSASVLDKLDASVVAPDGSIKP